MSPTSNVTDPLPLVVLLRHAVRWFEDALIDRLRAAGISPVTMTHVTVFAHLDPDGTSIAELARRAGVSRQSMHRAVHQLLGEGLLATASADVFPRTTLVYPTEAGAQRRKIALRILADLEAELASYLGDATLAGLRAALTRDWTLSTRFD